MSPQMAILGMTAGHFLQLCPFHFVRETSFAITRRQMSYNMAAAAQLSHGLGTRDPS